MVSIAVTKPMRRKGHRKGDETEQNHPIIQPQYCLLEARAIQSQHNARRARMGSDLPFPVIVKRT
ncbi:MAG: hypothetical protein O7B81_16160, partial [Gammaproteobacteria bacterium]|nr:hypothetical protein [Gammaproteobacteria bacterium]